MNLESSMKGHFTTMNIDRLQIEHPFVFTHSAGKCAMKFEVSIFDSNGFMIGGSTVASETK